MGFLSNLTGKKTTDSTTPAAPAPSSASTTPTSGSISLKKGDSISLKKTASASIIAENGWTAKKKDYDLKALVRYRDGRTIYIGAANRDEKLSTSEGAVRHSGDVPKGSKDLERITIAWHKDIASVALSSYSAIENGTGSFKQYGVYVNIVNDDQVVGISAADASAASTSYTLCFGEVVFRPDQSFEVTNLEMYSRANSENRVGYDGEKVRMDIGPIGQKK